MGCIRYSTRGCIGRGQGLNRAAEWIARLQGKSAVWSPQGDFLQLQGKLLVRGGGCRVTELQGESVGSCRVSGRELAG